MRGLSCVLLALNLLVLLGVLFREGSALETNAADGAAGGNPTIQNGDSNGDGARDISDAVYLLNWLFGGGPEPVAIDCGNPSTETICNDAIDNDGDGLIDLADPDCSQILDLDLDGFAGAADCDDTNASIHPGATEVCDNGIDDDCDGRIDSGDSSCAQSETVCNDAVDNDGDGLIDIADPDCSQILDLDLDGFAGGADCDDTNASIHPGAMEVCDNGIDDDCNTLIDAGDPACP